jgi:hypothetical protein
MSAVAPLVALPPVPVIVSPPGARDFDFLFGRWQIRNRRLRQRLVGSQAWDEFEARSECRPLLGGLGNIETYESDWLGGFHGLALRLFEPAARCWSIHWASNRDGVLQAPVCGGFDAGVGTFTGPEHDGEREVLSRYRWSQIESRSALWDQAWSLDAGGQWETNWVMHFTRIDD